MNSGLPVISAEISISFSDKTIAGADASVIIIATES